MIHEVKGTATPLFKSVRQTFQDQFDHHGEVGASLCVWHKGKQVIDLWGGVSDLEGRDLWRPDHLTTIFSCTKGLSSMCLLMLADRGVIDYETPLVEFWPELEQHNDPRRSQITIRHLVNHRSGLLGIRSPLSIEEIEDEERLLQRLEGEPLRWTPGEKQGYHGVTFGLYVGALFKKITQESIGQFFHREIAQPLKADVYLGLPEELDSRTVPIFPNTGFDLLFGVIPHLIFGHQREGAFFRSILRRNSHTALAFGQPAALGAKGLHNFNTRRVRALELPWANAQATARGLAKVYHALLSHQLTRPEMIQPLTQRQSWSTPDEVLRKPMGFSQGFVKEERHLFSPNIESFGHPGAGGALGWVDPKEELVIAYIMNRMGYHVRSPRALALCHAIYQSLGYKLPLSDL